MSDIIIGDRKIMSDIIIGDHKRHKYFLVLTEDGFLYWNEYANKHKIWKPENIIDAGYWLSRCSLREEKDYEYL